MTYKRDVADLRESPALEIAALLCGRGAEVSYSDPHVPELTVDGRRLRSEEPDAELLAACDLAIVVTDHSAFDWPAIAAAAPLLFDTRNAVGSAARAAGGSAAGGNVHKL